VSTIAVGPGTIPSVELAATVTIWALFSCFLLMPRLGFRPLMHRTAMALLAAELLALAMWSYGSEGCVRRPCSAVAETGRTAAAIDVPLLALAFVSLAIITGVRGWRRERRVSD
jgi:hypothetical protein